MNKITINEGIKDGVEVFIDRISQQAIIGTPRNFDVYWMFSRKDQHGIPYAESQISNDPARAYFGVPLNELGTDNKVRDFNHKTSQARDISKALVKEYEDLKYVVTFDRANGKEPAFMDRLPRSGYVVGEVVHTGRFFAVLEQAVKDDKRYFQIIKTNSILSGNEFLNREEAVQQKLPIGSRKFLTLGERGKINISEYKPKVEPVAALTITREQKEALMAFRESNRDDWKEKLSDMWTKASYPGVPKEHAPLLQQLRNQQGPAWLAKLTVETLYLGTAQPSPQQAFSEPSASAKQEAAKEVEKKLIRKPAAKRTKKLEQEM